MICCFGVQNHKKDMIVIDKAILSDDLVEKQFVCHIERCKGECCEAGDLGAPLTDEELSLLEIIYPAIKPYLSPAGVKAIEQQGLYLKDFEGDYSTPTINGGLCAYALKDEKGYITCGIEKAYLEGKTTFRKPISCHLYPIRITQYDDFEALNYHRWDICHAACSLGEKLGIEVYKFLKEPLVRKYGEAWYAQLCQEVENRKNTPKP